MGTKLVITRLAHRQREYIANALFENNRLIEVYAQPEAEESLLGTVYVGRVKDVAKNLNAAFVEIKPGLVTYLPMEEFRNPIFVRKQGNKPLSCGDELLVEVVREAIKTKPPCVSTNISFRGNYLLLTTANSVIGVSKKLSPKLRAHHKKLVEEALSNREDEEFGVVVRTNSAQASDEELTEELSRLRAELADMKRKAVHLTCFSCVRHQEPEYRKAIRSAYKESLEHIETDDALLYEAIREELLSCWPKGIDRLSFYEDRLLPLPKCLSLEKQLEDALSERVWLKSGGYLLIQLTEALTVIDVNSGKSVAKKDAQEYYRKINREAACACARQLRLRNISGMILIDFINMESAEANRELLNCLSEEVAKDPVPTQVIDMTKLGLVEVTRKKVKKSLREQLAD